VVISDPYGDYTCHTVVDSEVVIRSITSFVESIKLLFHNLFCAEKCTDITQWIY